MRLRAYSQIQSTEQQQLSLGSLDGLNTHSSYSLQNGAASYLKPVTIHQNTRNNWNILKRNFYKGHHQTQITCEEATLLLTSSTLRQTLQVPHPQADRIQHSFIHTATAGWFTSMKTTGTERERIKGRIHVTHHVWRGRLFCFSSWRWRHVI